MPIPHTTPPKIWLPGGLGVQDAPGRNCVDDAGDSDDAQLFVDLDLGEDRRMHVVRTRLILGKARGLLLLDAVDAAMAHGIGNRYRACRIALAHELAIGQRDLIGRNVCKRRIRHLLGEAQQLVADRVGRRRDPIGDRGRDP